jgi:leader peptidase (prepilin peptidase)/N-methyltransferase
MLDPTVILGVGVTIAGLLVGSFLNVVIYRVPRGESVVHPRSHCPACGYMIPGWLNVPVVSWLFLRGRCAQCKTPISPRYPLVELLTGLLWLACFRRFGPTPMLPLALAFVSGLVVATFVDIDLWEIPDEVTLPGTLIAVVAYPFTHDGAWWGGLTGAAAGAAFLGGIRALYLWLRGVEAMGLGDVKLIAMIGGVLGPTSLLPVILVASTSGSIIGGLVLAFARRDAPEAPASEAPAAEAPAAEVPAPEARTPEAPSPAEDDDDWTPPPGAVKFGPFLAIGALAELFMGPLLRLVGP